MADTIVTAIQDLGLKYPTDEAKMAQLAAVRERLEKEMAEAKSLKA